MEIVLSALSLDLPGDVQTYMLTVAPQLERLGHEVTLHSPRQGVMADLARARGLRVALREDDLPETCDAIIAQDAASGVALADRYPEAARVFVAHGAELDVHLPPMLDGLTTLAVAMNDAVVRRLEATANPPRIARLRQPIDATRHPPVGVVRERPERVLVLGDHLEGPTLDALARVCEEAGVACRHVGRRGEQLTEPARAINEADVVVGMGRSALEAMAAGRAAWVSGPFTGDGWVTSDAYSALEADGFRGRAGDEVLDAESFGRALAGYRPEMGAENRRLVLQHHSPYDHAMGLLEALGLAPPPERIDAPLRELARLVRTQFDAQSRVDGVALELRDAYARLGETHDSLVAANDELSALREENNELRSRWSVLTQSRRWQVAGLLARPAEAARGRRSG